MDIYQLADAMPSAPSVEALDLYCEFKLKGHDAKTVADKFNVSRTAVYNASRRVEDWIEKCYQVVKPRLKNIVSTRLDTLYRESMKAFFDSQGEIKKVVVSEGGRYPGSKTTTEISSGNPRFLAEARTALSQFCSLHGLDEPKKIESEGTIKVDSDALTPEQQELAIKASKLLDQMHLEGGK